MAVSDASDFWTNLEKLQQRLLLEKRSYEVRKYCDSSESMPTAERSGRRSSQSQSDRRLPPPYFLCSHFNLSGLGAGQGPAPGGRGVVGVLGALQCKIIHFSG